VLESTRSREPAATAPGVKRRHTIGDGRDCFARRAATDLVIAVCEKHSPAVAEVALLLCHEPDRQVAAPRGDSLVEFDGVWRLPKFENLA
jgi:hypothetical protein